METNKWIILFLMSGLILTSIVSAVDYSDIFTVEDRNGYCYNIIDITNISKAALTNQRYFFDNNKSYQDDIVSVWII